MSFLLTINTKILKLTGYENQEYHQLEDVGESVISIYIDLFTDLLRCESLNSLDSAACGRVLQKNYRYLINEELTASWPSCTLRYQF